MTLAPRSKAAASSSRDNPAAHPTYFEGPAEDDWFMATESGTVKRGRLKYPVCWEATGVSKKDFQPELVDDGNWLNDIVERKPITEREEKTGMRNNFQTYIISSGILVICRPVAEITKFEWT